jgi:phosphoglycolate phosphatase
MRCAIFDLDGTLVDSSSDLVSAGNAALREMGLPEVLDARADGSTALRGGGRAMLRLGFARAG